MSTASPTKPLFTARFTLVNVTPYSSSQIMNAFAPALKAANYIIYQTPSIASYIAKHRIEKEGPFPDDDTKGVYETMSIMGPAGKEIGVGMDIVNDPKGSRPILEQRKPYVTAITWNIGPPPNAAPQNLADLLWEIRRKTLYNSATFTGIGWAPLAASWANAPYSLPPYPNRPPIPAQLLPAAPKPKPKPKPAPKLVVKPAPKPKPKPAPKPKPKPKPKPAPKPAPAPQSLFSRWQTWALASSLAWVLLGDD